MRSLLLLASGALFLAFATSGCEAQPYLGRCESQLDCDRSTTPVSHCVQYANPSLECSSSGSILDCVCCPTASHLLDQGLDQTVRQHCSGGGMTTDTGVPTDAVVADQLAPHACNPACTAGVTYCADGTCLPLLSLGTTCTDDSQCLGSHCTSSEHVCCQVACAASGYSCTLPGLAGLCLPLPMDAGTDTAMSMPDVVTVDVPKDAGSTDASMDAALAE